MFIVGIDPGPVVGIALLWVGEASGGDRPIWLGTSDAAQATPGLIGAILVGLAGHQPVIAVERFVVGPRAARSATASAGAVARDVVAIVEDWARAQGLPFHARSAVEVKPWATDARLSAVGLLDLTAGMRHARDAARHALFCAVRNYGLPDPLSLRASKCPSTYGPPRSQGRTFRCHKQATPAHHEHEQIKDGTLTRWYDGEPFVRVETRA